MILGFSHLITSSSNGISIPASINSTGYKLAFKDEHIDNPIEKSLFLTCKQQHHSIYFYTSVSYPAVEVVTYNVMDTHTSSVTFENNEIRVPSRLPHNDLCALAELLNISHQHNYLKISDIPNNKTIVVKFMLSVNSKKLFLNTYGITGLSLYCKSVKNIYEIRQRVPNLTISKPFNLNIQNRKFKILLIKPSCVFTFELLEPLRYGI